MTKRGVVLFNLGGPDRLDSIEPFLFNLFFDPAVIRLPVALRWPIAKIIANRRRKTARGIFEKLGGGSPLLMNTHAQALALEARLGVGHRVVVAMRYWHPFATAAAAELRAWGTEEVLLLPLYPQFSTTTTASSLANWQDMAARAGLQVPTKAICCYPEARGFIAAVAQHIRALLRDWRSPEPKRILFSAHGLPERIASGGDPYVWQVERTVAAIRCALAEELALPGLDSRLCFQSRVGPLKWIGPSIDEEIRRAGAEGTGLLIVPVAFVSEHSETLVELDVEFRHLAGEVGVPTYLRAPTVGTDENFIGALASLVKEAFARPASIMSGAGQRLCPAQLGKCPCGGSVG
jgi:protoporphyrin/coproporphyrin ferrochelatase